MTQHAREPADPALAAREGVLLFDAAGRAVGGSGAEAHALEPPVTDLRDLAARFQQPDGMPISLNRRTRQVGVPVSGHGRRVLIVADPVERTGRGGFDGVAVSLLPFHDEDDPNTLLRALGSVLAHELRTPITTIYAGAELAASHAVADGTRIEAARSVAGETERLRRIVEDLVVLVRWSVDAPPEPEPLLLRRLVASTAERLGSPSGARLELDIPPDLPAVMASETHAEHAIRNLIVHAAANAPAGSPVRVSGRSVGDVVELHIVDAGPGRDAAAGASAFDLFARGPRSAADASGANLAMVVARRMIERMGGTVRAEAADHGITVVALPAID